MPDGDDREENSDNKQPDPSDIPDLENLDMAELNPEDLEQGATEYAALDTQLDQLDACLDNLEARNDDLMAKVRAFLQESAQSEAAPAPSSANGSQPGPKDGDDGSQGEKEGGSDKSEAGKTPSEDSSSASGTTSATTTSS